MKVFRSFQDRERIITPEQASSENKKQRTKTKLRDGGASRQKDIQKRKHVLTGNS